MFYTAENPRPGLCTRLTLKLPCLNADLKSSWFYGPVPAWMTWSTLDERPEMASQVWRACCSLHVEAIHSNHQLPVRHPVSIQVCDSKVLPYLALAIIVLPRDQWHFCFPTLIFIAADSDSRPNNNINMLLQSLSFVALMDCVKRLHLGVNCFHTAYKATVTLSDTNAALPLPQALRLYAAGCVKALHMSHADAEALLTASEQMQSGRPVNTGVNWRHGQYGFLRITYICGAEQLCCYPLSFI